MKKLEGVIPVLLTPLTKSGDIDEPSLIKLVNISIKRILVDLGVSTDPRI